MTFRWDCVRMSTHDENITYNPLFRNISNYLGIVQIISGYLGLLRLTLCWIISSYGMVIFYYFARTRTRWTQRCGSSILWSSVWSNVSRRFVRLFVSFFPSESGQWCRKNNLAFSVHSCLSEGITKRAWSQSFHIGIYLDIHRYIHTHIDAGIDTWMDTYIGTCLFYLSFPSNTCLFSLYDVCSLICPIFTPLFLHVNSCVRRHNQEMRTLWSSWRGKVLI